MYEKAVYKRPNMGYFVPLDNYLNVINMHLTVLSISARHAHH